MAKNDDDLLRRSIRVAGHPTSISMERIFWDEFRKIVKEDGRSMTDVISEIDTQRSGGLSRAVRIYTLKHLRSR